jgi:hypothetical protein
MEDFFKILYYIPYVFGFGFLALFLYGCITYLIDYIKNFKGNILKRILLILVSWIFVTALSYFIDKYF